MDFMMAAVDLSYGQFIKYCEKAYEIFFNNEIYQVDKQEFIEKICQQNMKKQLVETIIEEIDENNNESITFDEFV
jgi:Ca2+-binding EF-hand superfamily protein